MNTLHNVLSLLPFFAAGLSAQSLDLTTAKHPDWIEARVDRADPGSLVVLVLGTTPTEARLPGGAVLGVSPDLITGLTIAGDRGTALINVRMPGGMPDFTILAQGVAVHPRLPLDTDGAVRVSNVTRMGIDDPDRNPGLGTSDS